MPREVFTAGQVLTAAELNVVSDQSVMVFAGTAARGSAIPSPTEGMVTYLQDSDEVEVYTTAWGALGGGKILQVVSTTKTDTFTSASTSFVDVTGLSVSITPSDTSSKVFVMVQTNVGGDGASSVQAVQLVRDSTAINIGDAASNRTRASYMAFNGGSSEGENYYGAANVHLSFLDSPNTTSATTYKLQALTTANNVRINASGADVDSAIYGRMASTITAIEVAG